MEILHFRQDNMIIIINMGSFARTAEISHQYYYCMNPVNRTAENDDANYYVHVGFSQLQK